MAEKKTPKTVHLEFFFGPSYFEVALAIYVSIFIRYLTYCHIYFKGSRGVERNYAIKDDQAINKIKKLMEKHYSDLDKRGLYKIMCAPTVSIENSTPPPLPPVHDLVKAMMLKPLNHEIPSDIIQALNEIENAAAEVLRYYYEFVVRTAEEAFVLFQKTPKQALCPHWIFARKHILNSSTADRIVKAVLKNSLEKFKATMYAYWKPNVPLVSSIIHGRTKESIALEKFSEENPDLTIVPSGKSQQRPHYMQYYIQRIKEF